jgi:hypothetical protein
MHVFQTFARIESKGRPPAFWPRLDVPRPGILLYTAAQEVIAFRRANRGAAVIALHVGPKLAGSHRRKWCASPHGRLPASFTMVEGDHAQVNAEGFPRKEWCLLAWESRATAYFCERQHEVFAAGGLHPPGALICLRMATFGSLTMWCSVA